jgi:acyl-CoA synthetase (AMP-forming)/AMP-acid ligase II
VPPDLIRRIGSDFSSRVAPLNGYGLTETTSSVVSNTGAQYLATPNSVGRPNPTARLRVTRSDGSEAAAGEVGEIWLGGAQVVRGYWNDEKATAAAFGGGWFRSGDLGYVDDRGFLHVVDRLKDMVIRGGENVYCAEVEARLFEHPAVADVAVIGLPHPQLGEEVAAVILSRSGQRPSAEAIRAFVAEKLAAFKVPSQVLFRDEPLPRNAVGKVLKRELRDALRTN